MKKDETIFRVHPEAIALLTEASWEFTKMQLYGGHAFSKHEIELAKQHIAQYYEDILPELFMRYAGKYFSYFCERVLMAKRYVMRDSSRYIPNPSLWFNPDNEKGFVGTRKWLEENLRKQQSETLKFYFTGGRMQAA
ncbi:MAG: hypothetical protein IT233_12650 [Bacteroidia bacterium]|nr:hypothetical protein [Bacteroidia bacterium]